MKNLMLTIIVTVSLFTGMNVFADSNFKWTKVENSTYESNAKSSKILVYENYVYSISEKDSDVVEIAMIKDDGSLVDVTPSKAICPEIYFGEDSVPTPSRTTALINSDKLYIAFTPGADDAEYGCYIKEYNLANNPAVPEFVCNYVPVLNGKFSTYGFFNMAYVNGGIEYIDLAGSKYRFTKNGNYTQSTKTYEAESKGIFVKNPYYVYSFSQNGSEHTFWTNKKNIYYINHARESSGCSDWSTALYSNAKSIVYNDGYLYIITEEDTLNIYEFTFTSTSSDRVSLTTKLAGNADASIELDSLTSLENNNDVIPVFNSGIMYIAGGDAIVAIDVKNPLNPSVAGKITCSSTHDARTMGMSGTVLCTKTYEDSIQEIETFKISLLPQVNATYSGENNVTLCISGLSKDDKYFAVMATYGNINGVEYLADFDYKDITTDGEYVLTSDDGERVVTYVWRSDLTPLAKFIK